LVGKIENKVGYHSERREGVSQAIQEKGQVKLNLTRSGETGGLSKIFKVSVSAGGALWCEAEKGCQGLTSGEKKELPSWDQRKPSSSAT